MKIVYIANARIPTEKAHGIQIMAMCEAFAAAGATVEMVLPNRRNHLKDDPFDFYQINKNFTIKKLFCLDLVGIVPGVGFWIQTLTFLISAKLYLQKQEYNVLYSREQYAARFFDNAFLEIHTLPWEISNTHKKMWQSAKGIVVITKYIKNKLISNEIPENKILLAPDGVDLKKFTPPSPPHEGGKVGGSKFDIRKELGLSGEAKLIVYTGHLYGWKGAGTLLATAKHFQSTPSSSPPYQGGEREGVVFVFVGGTEMDVKKFKAQAKYLDNVMVLGHKPHSEMPKYVAAADVLVLPNSAKAKISRSYTSPLKMFEYMASQRPIVASDLPSIREVLNESNAVLVEPDNAKALAEGIKRILDDNELANKISQKAYEDVQQYDWNIRAKNILQFIEANK